MGWKTRIATGLGAIVVSAWTQGCGVLDTIAHEGALAKHDPVTIEERLDEQGREIEPFDKLSSGLEEYIERIYFIDEWEFHALLTKAHTHTGKGIICLRTDYDNTDLYHEATHVRQQALDKNGFDFSKRWKEISTSAEIGKIKVKSFLGAAFSVEWENGEEGPKYGLMKPYGGTSVGEDVATFMEALGYKYAPAEVITVIKIMAKKPETIIKQYGIEPLKAMRRYVADASHTMPLYFADKNDTRYRRKIELLVEHNFLTAEEGKKLIEQLGCLRPLLAQYGIGTKEKSK